MQALQAFRHLTLNLLQTGSDKQLQRVQKQLLEQHHQPQKQQEPLPAHHHQDDLPEAQPQDQPQELSGAHEPSSTMGMAKRYFVETSPGGRQQVVSVKRSRSYGGHQNRVRELDYVKVSLDEWNGLVEKERKLQQVNRTVVDETNAVRAALLGAQADTKRLAAVVIPSLDKQIASLTVENESLRRACAGNGNGNANGNGNGGAPPAPLPSAIKKTYREEEKLRARVARLEEQAVELRSENLALKERNNRSLQRKADGEAGSPERGAADLVTDVEYWKGLSRSWRSRYLGLRKRYDELYDLLDTRSKKLRAYEDILERNGMV